MGIQPVQAKPMSTGKKIAIGAGVVVGAAATAATVAAVLKGRQSDAFVKLKESGETVKSLDKAKTILSEGFKEVFQFIRGKYNKVSMMFSKEGRANLKELNARKNILKQEENAQKMQDSIIEKMQHPTGLTEKDLLSAEKAAKLEITPRDSLKK